MSEDATRVPATRWLLGGGAMCAAVRDFDWSTTPLGPIDTWALDLRTIAGVVLNSRHPMLLCWGPELIQIYNDAYLPSLGVGKNVGTPGQRGRECSIGPYIEAVMLRGESSLQRDAPVQLFRNGRIENAAWTYGFSPVFDDANEVAGVLVVCTETTEQVASSVRGQDAGQLADLERERLLRCFAQAPAGICLLRGPAFVFDFVNEQYCRLVGRSDLVGKPLLDALPELRGQGFDVLLEHVVSSKHAFVGRELLVQLAVEGGDPESLTDVYIDFSYSPLRDQRGEVDGVAVFAFDVTAKVVARQRIEALASELQKSAAEFRTLAESLPQLAWAAQPSGFIDWYNRRWFEYTGTSLQDMAGWAWQSVHDPAVLPDVLARWQAALAAGHDFEMEFPLRRADGVFRWHLTRAVPLRDADGQIVRWFGTSTDIDDARRAATERSALLAEAQLDRKRAEDASRAKDDFLATASHELRTPLNAILGWARLLRAGRLDAATSQRGLATIERNASAQVRLIEDILDGSRIIAGKLRLEVRSLDLSGLVRGALETVRLAANTKGVELKVELYPEPAPVSGDTERLEQVVWNLCNNAIKFTQTGGVVTVRLTRSRAHFELSVADNGVGIDADFLPHVFDRFNQGSGATTRRHGGLGLGLALVRHLVEAHGGKVRAESPGPGCGATFHVSLPVQNSVTETARPANGPPLPPNLDLRGVHALVVDDESDARELLATVLRGSRAQVTLAASAREAFEILKGIRPTILISDVAMPETDGYELIHRVRTELGITPTQLPAIALTAHARAEDRERAVAAGFQAHVVKPVEPFDLLRTIANMFPAV